MKSTLFILLSLIVATTYASPTVVNLGALEFKKLIEKKDGIILDTRTTGEYASGHIEGSILIDLQQFDVKNTLLALSKSKPLYLYCYSGGRSISVANFLINNGFTQVYNLERGLMDWTRNNLPLTTETTIAPVSKVDAMTIADYQKLISSKGLVFIDFYAPWCAPCRQMMPMVAELKKEYSGKLSVIKINSDASKELSKQAKIPAVPYLVLYKNGKIVYSKEGFTSKEELKKVIDKHL